MSTEEEILKSTNEEINEIIDNTKEETSEIIEYSNNELLYLIHNDLGIITCFLIFFVLVIILKYIYKFFNMIFPY